VKDFGTWFSEQGGAESQEVDGSVWLKCLGCGKKETVDIKAYLNGDTGWYVDDDVEPDETYEGVCGGSQFCTP